jgi:hypothetical protein
VATLSFKQPYCCRQGYTVVTARKLKEMEYSNPMEPRGAEGSVVVFHVYQRKDLRRKL